MKNTLYKKWQFILISTIAVSLLLTACNSEPETQTYRVGILSGVDNFNNVADGFKAQMTELGYVEGENISYDFQAASSDPEKMAQIAEKFVADEVDLILAITTGAGKAAQAATEGTDIPVILTITTDMVADGFAESMSHPGGNFTGVANPNPTFFGKRLTYLPQMAPDVERLWLFYDPDYPTANAVPAIVKDAASSLGYEVLETHVKSVEDVSTILEKFATMDDPGFDAVYISPDPINDISLQTVIDFSNQRGIPVISNASVGVSEGALYSYFIDNLQVGQAAAELANKIFEGTKPGDLPVETGELFLTVNLKTAEDLGLDIPDEILNQADTIVR